MENIAITATLHPDKSDTEVIEEGISKYNDSKIGVQKFIPVGCFARVDGKIIGGIIGNLFWNYLYIDMMWLDEEFRKTGIGRNIILEIEKLAVENGIFRSHLCTASFQSLGFYLKCGYRVIGQLEDMPKGETEYYLYKSLK